MKEDLLHYLWKNKLIISNQLETTHKNKIQIISTGEHNHNSGPDFFNAQIRIKDQLWAGNVEIHVKSSDWYIHGHEKDSNYDAVILHVVWEHDLEVFRKDNSSIPTLQLKDYVNKDILSKYQRLFSSTQKWINCENDIHSIDKFSLNNWLERLYIERLEQKSDLIQRFLNASKNDWEAVLFKMLCKNFGLKINGDAFLNLANSIDFSIIRKERHNLLSLEALLYGQGALLEDDIQNGYYQNLQNEHNYLQKKYQLTPIDKSQVQFFRLRPNNFPTIRLAQLANLFHLHQNLFSKIIEITELNDFYKLFDISVSPFWKTNYSFTSSSKKTNKKLTKTFIDLLLINTIIPLQFMYLKQTHNLNEEKLFTTIKQIKSEKNTITEKFKALQVDSINALDSQALLQLKNEYCTKQDCLQCIVGHKILRC